MIFLSSELLYINNQLLITLKVTSEISVPLATHIIFSEKAKENRLKPLMSLWE